MKRYLLYLLLFAACICGATSLNDFMYVYRNDGVTNAFPKADVSSIMHSHIGLDGVYHREHVVQEVYTPDSVYRIPIETIDSISFVTPPPSAISYEAIDLGLPSGTKWCSCNVGATSPEDFGGYYAWGETSEKSEYTEENYAFWDKSKSEYINIGEDISGTEYDVAHVRMGGDWRMPTHEQQQELIDRCTWKRTQLNGVLGYMVTGPNGGRIFLPLAGYRCNDGVYNAGDGGNEWSSSLYNDRYAYHLGFFSGGHRLYRDYDRYYGIPVRAVCPSPPSPPSVNTYEAIDLGLPSGTKWCNCNVGATSPEDYGVYFAWGETSEKSKYTKENYAFYDKEKSEYINIGEDISGTEYDVAHVRMGGDWRMPTRGQQQELIDHCNWERTQLNGVLGYLVTGPNGGRIFLPLAGYRCNDGVYNAGDGGNEWSSSLDPNDDSYAYHLGFFSGGHHLYCDYDRYYGIPVRAVCPTPPSPISYKAIDLGLPSGTKWCSCNVGASSPEDYGCYFAWGETSEKSAYTRDNYAFWDKSKSEYINIGEDISGTEYDVAHVRMGGNWRMPTPEQQEELIDCCNWKWTQLNGVDGQLVTGPNGGQIFLPAAGYRWGVGLSYAGSRGLYWSSSLDPDDDKYTYGLDFYSGKPIWRNGNYRYDSYTVRAVCP